MVNIDELMKVTERAQDLPPGFVRRPTELELAVNRTRDALFSLLQARFREAKEALDREYGPKLEDRC